MKRLLIISVLCALTTIVSAQNSNPFKGKIYNSEFQVWIEMNFYENNITVPRQEIFGKLPGYFGAKRDDRKWLITNAVISDNIAKLSIINDYGSEDLTATLTFNPNGTYTLERIDGSNMKIAVNRKWVKLPKKLTFTPL